MLIEDLQPKLEFYFEKYPNIFYVIDEIFEESISYHGLDGTHTFVGCCRLSHFLNIAHLMQ